MQVATDNKNRTVSEIRHIFSKYGGNMGEQGSVAWMFERKGQIIIEKDKAKEDDLMTLVLDAGADDLRDDGDTWEVLTAPESFTPVLESIQKAGIPTLESNIAMVPKNQVAVEGKNVGGLVKLTDALEEHDDVQNVFTNADLDEKEMEALA